VDAALLDRERELEGLISGKAERQIRLLSGKHSDADAVAMRKELDSLTADLEQVRSRIRVASPQYAALMQPAPLSLDEIQSEVLDEDTVLLEYSLGAEKSYLWAVTPCSADVFELPASGEIEAAVKSVLDLVTARNEAYLAAAGRVANMLLGPVASRLTGKRLMIVADGILHSLPFDILPDPGAAESPLIVNHEIVTAPSASVMAVLRREATGRQTGEKSVAILADPVFNPDDARVARQREGAVVRPATDFVRLRFSRREADEIARLAPTASTLKALDFDASRETVFGPDFGGHRIVHFATHSVIDNERPELSGIVLSLYDRSGRPRNGFLRLYEIFNLRLASDLVVLSACQSALGREIRGEGLMGLTRGFLYAGAPRVVASLWKVDDRASAELMKRFYEGMLVRGERPAAALRNAQVAMWRTRGWDAPYYWGAYTLQGEWR
jgi:CHAT domain-containing protein